MEATFGNLAEKENLADAVRSACHNAVADNITDYLQDLRDCREDSLLEELDDLNLEAFYRDALEVSVAYMLMTRLGLRADDYFTADEFAHVYEFNTPHHHQRPGHRHQRHRGDGAAGDQPHSHAGSAGSVFCKP